MYITDVHLQKFSNVICPGILKLLHLSRAM